MSAGYGWTRAHGVCAAGLLLVALTGCDRAAGAAPAAGFQMPPAAVTVARVVSRTAPVYRDEIGRCVAREIVSIQPQATGPIVAIHFEDGAELAKGAKLFTIDPRPYEAQVALADANLAQDRAQLELAKLELDRAAQLAKSNAVSRQEVDARRGAVAVAEARVRSSEASLALAKINLGYCEIRSPISGRAGKRLVDVGNVVLANSNVELLVIQRQDPLYVEVAVPEHELSLVRSSHARGLLKVRVQAPGAGGERDDPREGAVEFVDSAVQSGTGTVKLRAQLANADRRFWPGQLVNVRIVLAEEGTLLVPAAAAQIGQQGPYVYVLKDRSKVELRPVRTGQRHGNELSILDGLALDEEVVVTGQLALFPNAPARVVEGEAK